MAFLLSFFPPFLPTWANLYHAPFIPAPFIPSPLAPLILKLTSIYFYFIFFQIFAHLSCAEPSSRQKIEEETTINSITDITTETAQQVEREVLAPLTPKVSNIISLISNLMILVPHTFLLYKRFIILYHFTH